MKTQKLLNSQFLAIGVIASLFFFADHIASTAIPLFILEIGGTTATAGTFISIIAMSSLLFRPFLGNLMDIKSRKLILIVAVVALSATTLFYGFANSIAFVLFLAVLHGLSISAITTTAPTIVADVTPSDRLGEGISLYGISMSLAFAIGPLVALYLINHFTYNITFKVAFGLSLVPIILTCFINYERKGTISLNKKASKISQLKLKELFEKTVLKPSLYQLLLSFGMAAVMTFIPIYAKSRGVDNIGLFFTIYAVSTISISFFTGRLVQRYALKLIFLPSLFLQFCAFILLAFANTIFPMLLAGVLYGIGCGASLAIINIIGMQSAPINRRGAANATMFAAMDIGIAIGSQVLGAISAAHGFTITFIIAAGVILLDMVLFSILNRNS